jgi:hypothetical protein
MVEENAKWCGTKRSGSMTVDAQGIGRHQWLIQWRILVYKSRRVEMHYYYIPKTMTTQWWSIVITIGLLLRLMYYIAGVANYTSFGSRTLAGNNWYSTLKFIKSKYRSFWLTNTLLSLYKRL